MSRVLQRLVHRDARIEELSDERAYGDGYWLYLAPGWSWQGETHFIHEDTVSASLQAMRDVVACNCEECKGHA